MNEVADPDEFDAAVLGQLQRLVPSDALSINDVDPVANRVRYLMVPTDYPLPPDHVTVFLRNAEHHPLLNYAERTGDGSAHKVSDFLSTHQWHGNPMYQEFYAPIGIEHQISFTLPAPRPLVVGIALSRSESDFTERDRLALDTVRPFLAQIWRNARERALLRSLLGGLGQTPADGSGVVLVTEPLRELTPGALTMLYRFFGKPDLHSPLPRRVEQWIEAQRRRLDGDQPRLARPLSAGVNGRRLVLRHLPATRWHEDVILLREMQDDQATTQLTAAGLSRREAEVLKLVADGATNAQVAQQLHVAPSTVKRHLDHIYSKLGVRGRMQAVSAARDLATHHAPKAKQT